MDSGDILNQEDCNKLLELCEDGTDQPTNVTSYGIEISRKKIRTVPINEQDQALTELGVSAYAQEEFEEGVLQQVDEAIEEQEKRIALKAADKNIQNIRDEIRTITEEIEKTDKAISACHGPAADDYHVKKSLISLRSHKETKLKQLQRLQAREKYALKDLNEIVSKRSSGQSKIPEVIGDIKFGITDFDLEDTLGAEPGTHRALASQEELGQSSFHKQKSYHEDKYDKIKARRHQIDFGADFSDTYSSDEEFVPFSDDESEEKTDEDFDECIQEKSAIPKKKARLGVHLKQLKTDLKSGRSRRGKKVVDDGDVSVYLQRMRELRVKEQLKQTGQLDIVQSDISEDEDNDSKEIALKGGFALPVKLWRKLYKYQRTGIKWLWELHCQEVGGILGDEMGLGKTIQVIAFLTGLKNLTKETISCGPILIACPATVLHQWVKEFHKWSPEFRVAILHDMGSYAGPKESLIKNIVKDKGVIVTSYTTLRIVQDELLRYDWHYVILDEGHKIRNPDAGITLACKQFATPHRLILSGSPLQNNLQELWSLFDFIYPGKLGTLPVFMAEFSVPITLGGYANANDVQVQTAYKCACVLRDTISPYLLRRLKKDVNASIQLPTKNEQVLFCRLTQEQRDLYKMYINSRDVTSILAGKMKVFPGLIMLRKICNHPDLTSAAGSLDWMKASKQAAESHGDDADAAKEPNFESGYGFWRRSGKLIVVESLLRLWKEQNHKVLLFSQTRQMLDILESFVTHSSYSYLRMDGSTSIGTRQQIVEKFNQDKSIFMFLLTTRVGGLGVNLIGANRIIIFDPDWNPSTDTQARERSWRIGQDKHVTIYRLLTTGTIEEKIYHRQIFKQFLTNRVLQNPSQRRFFKSNDLYELFTLGDEGPRNGTETNAIFAGTGSEIKLGAKRTRDKAKKTRARGTTDDSTKLPNTCGVSEKTDDVSDVCSSSKSIANEGKSKSHGNSKSGCLKSNTSHDSRVRKAKKKKKRTKNNAKVEGREISYLDKHSMYNSKDSDLPNEEKKEEDVLFALFEQTGVHSALKHDKIVEYGNPDYVLVEKEAERVAKQAAEALRKSREMCRNARRGVPTWTGNNGTAGLAGENTKRRFGVKRKDEAKDNAGTAKNTLFDGSDMIERNSGDTSEVSSANLLKKMRARRALTDGAESSDIDHNQYSINGKVYGAKETELVEEIRNFVALHAKKPGQATTQEILSQFKSKIDDRSNALFKSMLKQVCVLRKVNGEGVWFLKDSFK